MQFKHIFEYLRMHIWHDCVTRKPWADLTLWYRFFFMFSAFSKHVLDISLNNLARFWRSSQAFFEYLCIHIWHHFVEIVTRKPYTDLASWCWFFQISIVIGATSFLGDNQIDGLLPVSNTTYCLLWRFCLVSINKNMFLVMFKHTMTNDFKNLRTFKTRASPPTQRSLSWVPRQV